jgi:hypothetical protein
VGARIRRCAVCQLRLGWQPKDGDPRGAFAVLEIDGAHFKVTIERVEYDAEAVAEEARRAGLPGELAHKLVLAA